MKYEIENTGKSLTIRNRGDGSYIVITHDAPYNAPAVIISVGDDEENTVVVPSFLLGALADFLLGGGE